MVIRSSELFLGLARWNKMERTAWRIGFSLSVVWVVYVLLTDIVFFEKRATEPDEPIEQMILHIGANNDNPCPGVYAGMLRQVIKSSDQERQIRNREAKEYNDGYVSRGLTKAFGIPLAWMGALLTMIAVLERLQTADRRHANLHQTSARAIS